MSLSTTDDLISSPRSGPRYALLAVAVVVPALLILTVGSVPISLATVTKELLGGQSDAVATIILRQLRLPRVLTAAIAGSALALSGLLMQTVFRNPLAGPGVLGINAVAGLGVALVILVGARVEALGMLSTAAAAIIGAAGALVLIASAVRRLEEPATVLILGILLGYASSALTTVLTAGSGAEQLQRYIAWSYGSFNVAIGPLTVALAAAVILTVLAAGPVGERLDALLLGPRYAASLGVDVRRTNAVTLGAAGILTGLTTALCGPVAFVGVVVPHIARAFAPRAVHKHLLPAAALTGAALALWADLVAHLPGSSRVLPLNAVTALVGVPVVLAVLFKRGRLGDLS